MKRFSLLLALFLFLFPCFSANALLITVDPVPLGRSTDIQMPFNDLNGTFLNNLSQSLDFMFAGQKWALGPSDYEVSLTIQTNAGTFPGFMNGTGYLLDASGKQLGAVLTLGSADDSNGDMIVGLFPFWGGPQPFNHYGVHFDLTYPNDPSLYVAAASLGLHGGGAPVTIGPLPEPDITALLLIAMLGMLIFSRASKRFRLR